MTIALVLGGGAPNLTLMAGAVTALDDAGVEFDIVSTSGAGMLIGLLYAAPKGGDRAAALKNTVNMGVHDAIYRFFPVNFKVFHKPGTLAQAYTKFWQIAATWFGLVVRPNGALRLGLMLDFPWEANEQMDKIIEKAPKGLPIEDVPAVAKPGPRPKGKVGRNDPCPCGSGLKFKKCCLRNLKS